jgi:hypothetical protein
MKRGQFTQELLVSCLLTTYLFFDVPYHDHCQRFWQLLEYSKVRNKSLGRTEY